MDKIQLLFNVLNTIKAIKLNITKKLSKLVELRTKEIIEEEMKEEYIKDENLICLYICSDREVLYFTIVYYYSICFIHLIINFIIETLL